jgi:LacI family transcriptional regulator
LRGIGVNGVIAVPVSDAEAYNSDYLIDMNNSGVPVVLLDRDIKGANIDGVFMDNFNSGYLSAEAFIRNGHKNIAIICGPVTSTSGCARLNGYLAALKEYNLPVREEYIVYGDFKFDLAYQLTKRLLADYREITAIFAANSRMSRGCLLALAESGISVPDDMAFIACGRLDGNFDQISSVIYPTVSIGEECANILLEKIRAGRKQKNGPKKRTTFDMELVLRGSEAFPTNRQQWKGQA